MRLRATRAKSVASRARRPWTPAQLPNLALWLDAADASTITLNGSNISQWNDKSGNERNATQATAAYQPVYTVNAINGKAALRFASTAKSLTMPSGHYATDPKVFIVIKSTSNTPQLSVRFQGLINEFLFVFNATASNEMYFTRRGLEQRPVTHNVTDTTIYFADLFSDSIGDYYINGSLAPKAANIGNAGGTTNSNVIGVDNANTNRFQGDFAEYIVLSSIDTSTRQLLEGYLAWKWQLQANLPANHPFRNAPPFI